MANGEWNAKMPQTLLLSGLQHFAGNSLCYTLSNVIMCREVKNE
ncbi:hypothetical protein [Vibrio aestuarianus]|nr:hypothetical protein [Vibrio aestuarianus]